MTDEARQHRNNYIRAWRAANKDRVRRYNQAYQKKLRNHSLLSVHGKPDEASSTD